MNLLSIYQITHFGIGKRVELTPDTVTRYYMHDNSKSVVGEVDHPSRLYTFNKFISKYDSALLLMHDDCYIILWHEIFGHLKFKYMQQLSQHGMVTSFPNIHFSKGNFHRCIL
jgi:hypothetical protein